MNRIRTKWFLSAVQEGPRTWLWSVALVRLLVLVIAASGAWQFGEYDIHLARFLTTLYVAAFLSSTAYMLAVYRTRKVPLGLTWTQILLDFGILATTVNVTGGILSQFTFLLVIVVLEAGLLLGLAQGFVFATLATVLVGVQVFNGVVGITIGTYFSYVALELCYRFLIQAMAFYLAAFVTGYWNQRILRMVQFERDILDNMNNGFIMTSNEGKILVRNQFANALLVYSGDSMEGTPIDDVLRDASGRECPVMTALKTERDFINYEFVAQTGDGNTKLLGLTTSLMYDDRNRITGIIATFSDMTEMDRMRQELRNQDRLAVVGELATGLAHEIRNPVAAIRGAVDELGQQLESPQMARQLANLAIRESDHLNGIITGFLEFARNPELQRETFDLRITITEIQALLPRECPQAEENRIHIQLPEIPCLISGAPDQLRQVFLHLGKNAFEAMGEKGMLIITLVSHPTSVEIRFDDEGPGIPPDQVGRIFEPFYTEKEKGVGMGLAICSRIVTAHDGIIRAGSRTTGGATFTVNLPLSRHDNHCEIPKAIKE